MTIARRLQTSGAAVVRSPVAGWTSARAGGAARTCCGAWGDGTTGRHVLAVAVGDSGVATTLSGSECVCCRGYDDVPTMVARTATD